VSLNRYAKRRDPNEPEIVAALRAAGAVVWLLDQPLDLLVSHPRAGTVLIEVKSPEGPRGGKSRSGQGLNKNQREFVATWPGKWGMATTAEEALAVIGVELHPRRAGEE
jgi:hypothetical protein